MAKRRGKYNRNKPLITAGAADVPGAADRTPAAADRTPAAADSTPVAAVSTCRLCEMQEGPFLDIFDPAKIKNKIQKLMPFEVTENEDLPRKICFRCSAKVEELHEFIERCIKTDQNLHVNKKKTKPIAETVTSEINKEEHLNPTPVISVDLCEKYIKRAVENMKCVTSTVDPPVKHDSSTDTKQVEAVEVSSKKVAGDTNDQIDIENPLPNLGPKLKRSSRSNVAEPLLEGLDDPKPKRTKSSALPKTVTTDTRPKEFPDPKIKLKNTLILGSKKVETEKGKISPNIMSLPEKTPNENNIKPKEFNIMDHISTIQVNGVGPLFQCQLCNRNFYKMEIVTTHGCAKTGVAPPAKLPQRAQPPQPPKAPTVQYINTKQDKKDKHTTEKSDVTMNSTKVVTKIIGQDVKAKPRIGPASKVRRDSVNPAAEETRTGPANKERPQSVEPAVVHPVPTTSHTSSVPKPIVPSANSVYKLVLGPQNTYTLVEEQSGQNNSSNSDDSKSKPTMRLQSFIDNSVNVFAKKPNSDDSKKPKPGMRARKRQAVIDNSNSEDSQSKPTMRQQSFIDNSVNVPAEQPDLNYSKPKPTVRRQSVFDDSLNVPAKMSMRRKSMAAPKHHVENLISDDDDEVVYIPEQNVKKLNSNPYPIGLYQSVPRASNEHRQPSPVQLPVFGVPEAKKHTYTIIKTDNPNRLLISSKPQIPRPEAPKPPLAKPTRQPNPASRPTQLMHTPGTSGYGNGNRQFTYTNAHPLQYGKPLSVKESTIPTSLNQSSQSSNFLEIRQDYKCNICPQKFSRETKLQAHVQAHFTKLDQ